MVYKRNSIVCAIFVAQCALKGDKSKILVDCLQHKDLSQLCRQDFLNSKQDLSGEA